EHDSIKLAVMGDDAHLWIGPCLGQFARILLALCEINQPLRPVVNSISHEQQARITVPRVAVKSQLAQSAAIRRLHFGVDEEIGHLLSEGAAPNSSRAA